MLPFVFACTAALLAQQAPKPPVPYSAYDGWNAIRGTTLSRDGAWLVYAQVPEDGDGMLIAHNLESGVEHRAARGENPAITADGRYVVFTIAPKRAARDAATRKAKGKPVHAADKPHSGFGVMNLATGEVFTADNVKGFHLAKNGSAYVAYQMEPPKPSKRPDDETPSDNQLKPTPASDLIVRTLAGGASVSIPGVTEYAWSDDGERLAYATHDGVAVWTPDAPARQLEQGAANYVHLAWSKAGDQLAFVSDVADPKANPPVYHLYRAAGNTPPQMIADTGLSQGMQVSQHGAVSFSSDGQRIFLGIAPPPPPSRKDDPPITQVDLWSWTDAELQPMQKLRASEERDASYPAVVNLSTASPTVVALGSADMPDLELSADQSRAVLSTDTPYELASSWQGENYDYDAVNLTDGSRRQVLHDIHFQAHLSPAGKYLLYFNTTDNHWHTVRLSDGHDADLTAGLSVQFQDERWDQPSPPSPYGEGGWTANDAEVLLYDRYDIWAADPDGGPTRNLTAGTGRAAHLVFRITPLDPEAKTVSAGPLLLSATNDDTLATGFYRLPSATSPARPVALYNRSADLGRPMKAKNSDRLVFTEQRFNEFPDLWASTTSFTAPRRISDANPQQATYRWGSARLIHYTNRDGKRLAATLITPDNFDPHQQYPLIVYIYERLSQNLNHYVAPAPGTNINLTRYASHGYVVLEPDIVYDVGHPGDSALKCVLPAIATVEAMGFIDPHRIGIQGHSWGGYQVAYMVTQTNIFRAVEAGAVVANMTSAYGGIRWGTGMSREFQYEHTQSRIGGPPWSDSLLYMENSPLFSVESVHTPYLTIHNDADTAVPWYQGIEFFTALRRLRKPAWMFVFNGEAHGLQQRPNQKYWTVRLDEYFDYWLNHGPEPAWMKQGVPYLQRGEESVDGLYNKQP